MVCGRESGPDQSGIRSWSKKNNIVTHGLILEMTIVDTCRALCSRSHGNGCDVISQAEAVELVIVEYCFSLRDEPFKIVALAAKVNQNL